MYYLAFAWSLLVLNLILNYLNKYYFVSLLGIEFSIFISLFVIFIGIFTIGIFCWIKYRLLGIYIFVIPFILGLVLLFFVFTLYVFDLNRLLYSILKLDDDKELNIQVSKEAMKETTAVVSDGVYKFAVNVGGYGTAADAAGIQKVATSGAPLAGKAIGVVGLSIIGTAGALSPAVYKYMGSNNRISKPSSDSTSNSLLCNPNYDLFCFNNLEYYNIINNFILVRPFFVLLFL